MQQERRTHVRVTAERAIANCRLLSLQSGNYQFAVWPVKNLSITGAALTSEEKVPAGTLAFLNIDLDVLRQTIGVIGKIVRCAEAESGYDLAINFSWWPKETDLKRLSEFVICQTVYNEKTRGRKL